MDWSKSYSTTAMQMMKKMGYENHRGLGKLNQGRLEPIVATEQSGREGFGLKTILRSCANEGEYVDDNFTLPEIVNWLKNPNKPDFHENYINWIKTGLKKLDISDETLFCRPDILKNILSAKNTFSDMNDIEFRKARSRCNPFETIRSSIFINRAAVKMANIDATFDFMFSHPVDRYGNSLVEENELLYFADLCAGPGGFSEYILYRKSWDAKGFGLTLRGPNDFKLDKFFAGPSESLDAFYGVNDNGNIFDDENQNSFASYVKKHCKKGVHFVMADGGFSVEGQENIQEILSKQLYLCQFLLTLKVLRESGSFVCKLFDLFTPFSVGLVYLMYKCFDQISIFKPNSSRPANSERYLICKWRKSETDLICKYLNAINDMLNNSDDKTDVLQIVDLKILQSDQNFFNFIYNSNNNIGINQITHLQKIYSFYRNPELKEMRQAEFRKRCLEIWKLPDTLRQAPQIKLPEKLLEEILSDWYNNRIFLLSQSIDLNTLQTLQTHVESVFDWYFLPIGRGETNINNCSIFLCNAKGHLLRLSDKRWETIEYNFDVIPYSLFYGEIVNEFSGEGKTQTLCYGLHIIDAVMLGGKDIRRLKLSKRIKLCEKYCLSINKPFRNGKRYYIRSKELFKLMDIKQFFRKMKYCTLKDNSSRLGLCLDAEGNKFFVPGGIILLCEITNNIFSQMSKTRKMLYYFDKRKKQSFYEDQMPPHALNILYASFRNSFIRRLLWKWVDTKQVEEQVDSKDEHILYRQDLELFLLNKSKQ